VLITTLKIDGVRVQSDSFVMTLPGKIQRDLMGQFLHTPGTGQDTKGESRKKVSNLSAIYFELA